MLKIDTEFIENRMRELGITRGILAKTLGVNRNTPHKWLNHPEMLSVRRLSSMLALLKCKVSDVVYDSEDRQE